jgi:sulfatase modifying factor 1
MAAFALGVCGRVEAQGVRFEGYTAGQSRTDNGTKIVLRWCPPGEFMMGSPANEFGRNAYEKQHRVKLTKGFWLGETEVTQEQWTVVMGKTLQKQALLMLADEQRYPHSGKQITLREALGVSDKTDTSRVCGATAPAVPIYYVSWDDAMQFCTNLTASERKAGRLPTGCVYSLPTEAEWEYACRASTTTATYAGDIEEISENNVPMLHKIAWYAGNSGVDYKGAGWTSGHWPGQAFPNKLAGPRRVGQKDANKWGLKDMLGNMYEWVYDFSSEYPEGEVTDPRGPATGTRHVYRGGAWNNYGRNCRAANSLEAMPTYRMNDLGFRVALVKK